MAEASPVPAVTRDQVRALVDRMVPAVHEPVRSHIVDSWVVEWMALLGPQCSCVCRCGVARDEHDEMMACTESRLSLYCSGFELVSVGECPAHPAEAPQPKVPAGDRFALLRRAIFDPGTFVDRELASDGDLDELHVWQAKAADVALDALVAPQPKVLSEVEATWFTQPTGPTDPARWSAAMNAIIADSGKWERWPKISDHDGWWNARVAQSAIQNLYRYGFAVVAVDPKAIERIEADADRVVALGPPVPEAPEGGSDGG